LLASAPTFASIDVILSEAKDRIDAMPILRFAKGDINVRSG
jgi:hypothetical protein